MTSVMRAWTWPSQRPYRELPRHGDFEAQVRGALSAPGPGETLLRYADTVARHSGGSPR